MKNPFTVAEYIPEVNRIEDPFIREKTLEIWRSLYEFSNWDTPASLPVSSHKKDYPHLTHNRAVVLMAIRVADVLEEVHGVRVNRDYLICAALLQDASKLVEYDPDPENIVRKTDIGSRFPHSFYAAHMAVSAGLPNEITECILTHSPGSSEFPKTLIGKILFYVDQIDMAAIGGDRWKKSISIYR